MSLSYAARLKKGVDYGVCGLPELTETPRSFHEKAAKLVDMVKSSKYIVVMTGAGISTSTGIPDFRGPNGVWTKEQQGAPFQPQEDFRFEDANPSLTHMAILGLVNIGKVKYLISQNVDGLHIRSGIPKNKLSELHGNIFIEECRNCKKEYFRDFDVQSIGLKETGRRCPKCGKALYDVLLDWDDALPEEQLNAAEDHSRESDLMICLGTSLKVQPANKIPLLNQKHGGKMVLCNLQQTPVDKRSHLVIHSKCDALMQHVMNKLGIQIPVYVRTVSFTVKSEITSEDLVLTLLSSDGLRCPYILQLDISIVGDPEKTFKLSEQPFTLKIPEEGLPKNWKDTSLELLLVANFARGCTTRTFEFRHKVETAVVEKTHTVEITRIDFNLKKEIDLSIDLSMDDGFYELRSGKRSPMYKNLMPNSKPKKKGGGGRPKKKPRTDPLEELAPSAEDLKREQDVKTLWELFPEKKEVDIISALDATRNSVSKAANYLMTK